MADNNKHEHGSMDITEQQKAFAGFVRISAYVAGGSILLLLFIYAING